MSLFAQRPTWLTYGGLRLSSWDDGKQSRISVWASSRRSYLNAAALRQLLWGPCKLACMFKVVCLASMHCNFCIEIVRFR